MKKKIGFIDLFIDEWHSNNYPGYFAAAPRWSDFELMYAWEKEPFPGRRALAQWCADNNMTAASCIEEVVDKCDAICVLAPANPEVHEELADLPLRSGKPLYIDKPFADSLASAERIFEKAEKYGTPLMTSSALRFGDQLISGELQELNPTIFHTSGGGRSYQEYAIHQLEMIVSVMGTEVENLHLTGDEKNLSVALEFSGNRLATLDYSLYLPFTISAANAGKAIVHPAVTHMFENLTAAMLDFFATGVSPVPKTETLTIISMLEKSVSMLRAR